MTLSKSHLVNKKPAKNRNKSRNRRRSCHHRRAGGGGERGLGWGAGYNPSSRWVPPFCHKVGGTGGGGGGKEGTGTWQRSQRSIVGKGGGEHGGSSGTGTHGCKIC